MFQNAAHGTNQTFFTRITHRCSVENPLVWLFSYFLHVTFLTHEMYCTLRNLLLLFSLQENLLLRYKIYYSMETNQNLVRWKMIIDMSRTSSYVSLRFDLSKAIKLLWACLSLEWLINLPNYLWKTFLIIKCSWKFSYRWK